MSSFLNLNSSDIGLDSMRAGESSAVYTLKEVTYSDDVSLRTLPELMLRIRMIFFLDVADANEEGFSSNFATGIGWVG